MATANADDVTNKAMNKGSVGHDGRLDKRIGGQDGYGKQTSNARMKQQKRPQDNFQYGCRCRSLSDDFNATKTSTRSNVQQHQAMYIMAALCSSPNDFSIFQCQMPSPQSKKVPPYNMCDTIKHNTNSYIVTVISTNPSISCPPTPPHLAEGALKYSLSNWSGLTK